MENLTVGNIYSLLILLVAVCSLLGFFLGRRDKSDAKIKADVTNEVGIKKDLEAITNSLKELKEDISNLRDTMNDKMQEHSDQMKELNNSLVAQKILSEKLLSSYKSLHKRVDYLFDVLKVDRNIFSNSLDHEDEEVNK